MDTIIKSKTYDARRERFIKAKSIRLDKLNKSLESIGKLSIKSNHAYTEEDVEEITKTLSKGIYSVIHKFSSSADNRLKVYLEVEREHYEYLYENDPELFNLIKIKTPHLLKYFDEIEKQTHDNTGSIEKDLSEIRHSLIQMQQQLEKLIDSGEVHDD